MKVRVATTWYNEAGIAPHFLNHYLFADEVVVLLDADTSDNTREICARYKNVRVEPFRFEHGLDDVIKSAQLSVSANEPGCDWSIVVDADELVFPRVAGETMREALGRARGDVLWVPMFQMYRHRTEGPLDPTLPPVPQRTHGDTKIHHTKPCVVRSGAGAWFGPGCHSVDIPAGTIQESDGDILIGVHWPMVDADLAVDRYVNNRKNRNSPENVKRGHGTHYEAMTESSIRAECETHLDDPAVFG